MIRLLVTKNRRSDEKIVLVVVFSLFIGSTSLNAVGIGVEVGLDYLASYGNIAVTIKLDTQPWVFAVNARIYPLLLDSLGVSADRWILNDTLIGHLNGFVGWGLYANLRNVFQIVDGGLGFSVGGRIPFGLNMYFADGFIETCLQMAPSIGFKFHDGFGLSLFIPVNFGVRLKF